MEWVQAQKADPSISHVITRIEAKEVGTLEVSEEMSQEVKPYLRQKGQLCLKEGVFYLCRGQIQWDCNEFQLVIPPIYRLEAMHGAHHDVGQQMLNILCDRFYWPNMETNATCHVCTCEWCLKLTVSMIKQSNVHYWWLILWSWSIWTT